MRKKKFKFQLIVCMILALFYGIAQSITAPAAQAKFTSFVAIVSTHYTAADIVNGGKQAISTLIKAPVAVTNRITASQEAQQYGFPIGTTEKGETTSVYAVAGGSVIETGENDIIGKYIVIQHDDKNSIYGNCHNLYVKKGEHVRKGQVIASYVDLEGKDFYYLLSEK